MLLVIVSGGVVDQWMTPVQRCLWCSLITVQSAVMPSHSSWKHPSSGPLLRSISMVTQEMQDRQQPSPDIQNPVTDSFHSLNLVCVRLPRCCLSWKSLQPLYKPAVGLSWTTCQRVCLLMLSLIQLMVQSTNPLRSLVFNSVWLFKIIFCPSALLLLLIVKTQSTVSQGGAPHNKKSSVSTTYRVCSSTHHTPNAHACFFFCFIH